MQTQKQIADSELCNSTVRCIIKLNSYNFLCDFSDKSVEAQVSRKRRLNLQKAVRHYTAIVAIVESTCKISSAGTIL